MKIVTGGMHHEARLVGVLLTLRGRGCGSTAARVETPTEIEGFRLEEPRTAYSHIEKLMVST